MKTKVIFHMNWIHSGKNAANSLEYKINITRNYQLYNCHHVCTHVPITGLSLAGDGLARFIATSSHNKESIIRSIFFKLISS